jgi:multiple sugar transport system substrate-binding protein
MASITRRDLALTAGSLPLAGAACASSPGEVAGPSRELFGTVIFKTYAPGEPAQQAYAAAMEAWAKVNPRITLQPDITANSGLHQPGLTAQIAGGTPPDVCQVDWNYSVDFALDGLLLPLDDVMRKERVSPDEWFGGQMEQLRLGGKYHGLPITGHADLLYYNRDLFQRAGVATPPAQPTWRWQDVLAAAERLTRRPAGDVQASQWGLQVNFNLTQALGSAIWQNGGTITDTRENPTRTTLDAKAQDAIQWLVDLRLKHQVATTDADQQALGGNPFVLGKVAMFWGWSAHLYTTMAPIRDFWWDLTFVPRGPGGTQASSAANNHLAALKSTREPALAWKLMYFFAAEEGARLRSELQGIPPAHRRLFDEAWMKTQPAVRRQVLKETHPRAQGWWKGRGFGNWHSTVNTALAKAWNGTASVNAAVQDAIDQGTQRIRVGAQRT